MTEDHQGSVSAFLRTKGLTRLAALAPALQRRLLRYAAGQLGVALDFPATETVRALALTGRAGQKSELAQGLRAERTHRELRLTLEAASGAGEGGTAAVPEYTAAIPGEIVAPAFGIRLKIDLADVPALPAAVQVQGPVAGLAVTLRNWRPGDRVTLRHSGGPRKVKQVLERLRVTGTGRELWPVLELDGQIVWMRGVELEPEPGIAVVATALDCGDYGSILPPQQDRSSGQG